MVILVQSQRRYVILLSVRSDPYELMIMIYELLFINFLYKCFAI